MQTIYGDIDSIVLSEEKKRKVLYAYRTYDTLNELLQATQKIYKNENMHAKETRIKKASHADLGDNAISPGVLADSLRNAQTTYKKEKERPIEERISYKSPSNIDNNVRTSSSFGLSQPERDTLKFSDIEDTLLHLSLKVAALENALDSAINASSKTATLSNRGRIRNALYLHLVKGVPAENLDYHSTEFAKYKRRALVIAAINLQYIENTYDAS